MKYSWTKQAIQKNQAVLHQNHDILACLSQLAYLTYQLTDILILLVTRGKGLLRRPYCMHIIIDVDTCARHELCLILLRTNS